MLSGYIVVVVVVVRGECFLASNLALILAGQPGSEALFSRELGPLTHLMDTWVHLWPPGQLSHLWEEVRCGPGQSAH